jgi:hypothetical protein
MFNKAIKHRRPHGGRLDLKNLAVFSAAYGWR